MALQAERGVPLSTLCPKFLHTNSTSHTGPFSAIAELIDNAFDPDVCSKKFWIDKTVVQGQECLIFMDCGNGLDNETMHKMLSFGYSDKVAVKGVKPIGMYGNGFKSGAMRLGQDAIVFSKSKSISCVGMLSQTYLQEIKAKEIIVPIVCFDQNGTDEISVRDEQQASLKDILTFSPFKTQKELLIEIEAIKSSFSGSNTGTRIIIWNLRRTAADKSELDFETDRYDIRIPSDLYESMNVTDSQRGIVPSHIPKSSYSLRAYCQILYLKPRMQIVVRGQNVKSELIAKTLAYVMKDSYKPTFLNSKPIPIIFGYNTKSKDQYGVMMYHRNRLIKAYERVGCQLKADKKGVGVIGVIECGHFLEPTHNKQSFNETDKYRKTMNNLGIKLEDYWKEIHHKRQTEDPNNHTPIEDTTKRPDQNWAQCDECSRWRKLPDGIDNSKLPDEWYCHLNPDPQFRSCDVEEEPEDSDDEKPAYHKSYKQQERTLKKNQEQKRKREEEERKRQEKQRLADLAKQNHTLRQQKNNLQRELQLREMGVNSPSSTPRRFRSESPRGGAATVKASPLRSPTISQAACSSPSNSGLPVISNVRSLSDAQPSRSKRTQLVSPQTTPKRPRVNGLGQRTLATSTLLDPSPQISPSIPPHDDDDDDDATDDELIILETACTPKPQKQVPDLTKVKQEQCDANVGMLLECSDDAMETNDASTSSAPAPLPVYTSNTTQTEVHKVKVEVKEMTEEERAGMSVEQNQDVKIDVCSTETNHLDNEDDAGPSSVDARTERSPAQYPNIVEAQEQQDQLLELMQSTAQERDHFKEQVHKLSCQLQDKMQDPTQITVKKEYSHQAVQTEEEEGCYKKLFENAKQKVDELIRDKESLLAATETKPSTAKSEENDMDEIALQVDGLLRELDQRTKERDELRSQVDSLEEERASLASQCEELRMSLQQQRENAQERGIPPHRATDSFAQTELEDQEGANSRSDSSRSLIELRHNIGRLLVSIVPALDLEQVNYECNVIDEILEQLLCDEASFAPEGLRYRSEDT
ncbi:MORC family CW-type zinc finger protein 3a [Notolabrus celidotus]|uniref:MORC family CW-type zinc finger protein 3a n=1 Tax=Notolabrus celidotus TaxID=1203425 RepID=UPI00148F5583|nr:MORC family CW-type zinc finger protein 3a [Notolabrus celidotus]